KEPSKAVEPVVAATPADTKEPSKPAEPVVASTPTDTKEPSKPAEPVVAATPNAPTESNKPTEQTGTVPSDVQQSAAPSSSPRSRPARTRTAQNSATPNTPPANVVSQNSSPPSVSTANTAPPAAGAEKMTVEIVLVNGRKLRVDASIDPAVLTRLLAAIEGK